MGKIAIISFRDSEEAVIRQIYSLLVEEAHFEDLKLEQNCELVFPGLKINVKEKSVYIRENPIHFSYYEFYTLYFLAKHSGWVFSKEQIYEAVWKEAGEHSGSAVTNVIGQIRKKLREGGGKQEYIQTIINHGYKFMEGREG